MTTASMKTKGYHNLGRRVTCESQAFQRGVNDFGRRRTVFDPPYADRSMAEAWQRGWESAALKRHTAQN